MNEFSPSMLDILCTDSNSSVVTNRKCLQNYVANHIDTRGRATVICQGTVRRLVWRSLGAGLYEIWSVPLEPILRR